MRYDNSQLVHIWAQQNQDSGKNGRGDSLHFSGRSLYSYRTEIARFIEGRAVYSMARYSATTSSKHQTHIPSAVSHVENYRTYLDMQSIPDSWESAAPILFHEMLRILKADIEAFTRSRTKSEWFIENLANSFNAATRFFGKYINNHDLKTDSDQVSLADLLACSSNRAGFDFLGALDERFGLKIKEKITKNRAAEAARREKIALENAGLIAEWKEGKNSRAFHDCPIALRVSQNGENVETSRGASISTTSARQLWNAIQSKANLIGQKIEHFTVEAIDASRIVIGCHDIPMSEIERIAKALKLA